MGKIKSFLDKLKNNGIVNSLKGFFNSVDDRSFEYYGGTGTMASELLKYGIKPNLGNAYTQQETSAKELVKHSDITIPPHLKYASEENSHKKNSHKKNSHKKNSHDNDLII